MTVATKPDIIEGVGFPAGLVTSIDDAAQPDDSLRDVSNLLPQRGSSALKTRRGFARVGFTGLPTTHSILQIFAFNPDGQSKRLIAILTDGTANANNVQVWELNFSTLAGARIDTAGRVWSNPTFYHWGMGIGRKWYGGSQNNAMYSWDPTGPTWNADAAADPDFKTWVDAVDDAVTPATQYAKDFAWRGKEKVNYNSKAFTPKKSIRFDPWDIDAEKYSVGTRVSRKAVWNATANYWKSFRCVKSHVPSASNRPGNGTGDWKTYWNRVKFGSPLDDDNNLRPNWKRMHIDITDAAKSAVAAWFGERMWIRFDGHDKSKLQFSASLKFRAKKDEAIADVRWDPADWAVSLDDDGAGGGWVDFHDAQSHGPITAAWSFGQYLVVFKRQAIWMLSGESERTFNIRRLSHNEGTFHQLSVAEHEGLLYFADEDGLKVTDGTQVQPVPGMENILDFWKTQVDAAISSQTDRAVTVTSYGGYIWVGMSYGATKQTLVYFPPTASWWKTTLPLRSTAVTYVGGVARMYFTPGQFSYGQGNKVYQYEVGDQDDDGAAIQGFVPIPWNATTAWWGFGTLHQERRIRRVWAVVKGAMTYTIKTYRDWAAAVAKTTNRVVSSSEPDHIEGEVVPDSHAISYDVSGPSAPAAFHSLAVQTQPRRRRYHRGG